ncbi:MAG: type I methionyl aminopeptidase [Candidatus Kerfeldbacteria bacterium CG_4_10_14_0_8_um_filter_42_10]|uniref:Methionine aminopeptidase n=1 Tax=Candidatus Kerfeldbacteria bacterium CG_4_10_14_0_8_um_filter_42_10 TaxID=2014248 RepID=A0A2M7RHW1_9BACT|nr:MAG: type I methionyl aminopeptidase [Candidatus Kerfeldbacteria bacterium CG_4_10_14_0_8_um_filter_42_10]
MITIKNSREIEIMREGGRILATVLKKVVKAAKPGISTKELDLLAEKLIRQLGGEPAFLGYQSHFEGDPYPASICTSVNEEVVHTIPSANRILKKGDIIGIDAGVRYKGFCTDMARTVGIGGIYSEKEKLIQVTKKALSLGIKKVKAGRHTGDIGAAIQKYVEQQGFSVVTQLVGHGIGKNVHEEPRIPNFGEPHTGTELKEGMTIAIEPMVNIGGSEVKTASDGWKIVTNDNSLSAHFEDTVAVTKKGFEILTQV